MYIAQRICTSPSLCGVLLGYDVYWPYFTGLFKKSRNCPSLGKTRLEIKADEVLLYYKEPNLNQNKNKQSKTLNTRVICVCAEFSVRTHERAQALTYEYSTYKYLIHIWIITMCTKRQGNPLVNRHTSVANSCTMLPLGLLNSHGLFYWVYVDITAEGVVIHLSSLTPVVQFSCSHF